MKKKLILIGFCLAPCFALAATQRQVTVVVQNPTDLAYQCVASGQNGTWTGNWESIPPYSTITYQGITQDSFDGGIAANIAVTCSDPAHFKSPEIYMATYYYLKGADEHLKGFCRYHEKHRPGYCQSIQTDYQNRTITYTMGTLTADI